MSPGLRGLAIALLCLTSSAAAAAAPAGEATCRMCTEPAVGDSAHAVIVRRARLASRVGEWSQAAELWQSALLMNGRAAEHWIALGDVLSKAERYREAVAAYQRSIQLDHRVARGSTRRVARAFALMGNDRQAVRWLEQSLRAGVAPDELWGDVVFERYRNEPRLRVVLEQRVELRGRGMGGRGGASA
jgi:tetratricopeptide (TPR) repeat protein